MTSGGCSVLCSKNVKRRVQDKPQNDVLGQSLSFITTKNRSTRDPRFRRSVTGSQLLSGLSTPRLSWCRYTMNVNAVSVVGRCRYTGLWMLGPSLWDNCPSA